MIFSFGAKRGQQLKFRDRILQPGLEFSFEHEFFCKLGKLKTRRKQQHFFWEITVGRRKLISSAQEKVQFYKKNLKYESIIQKCPSLMNVVQWHLRSKIIKKSRSNRWCSKQRTTLSMKINLIPFILLMGNTGAITIKSTAQTNCLFVKSIFIMVNAYAPPAILVSQLFWSIR